MQICKCSIFFLLFSFLMLRLYKYIKKKYISNPYFCEDVQVNISQRNTILASVLHKEVLILNLQTDKQVINHLQKLPVEQLVFCK